MPKWKIACIVLNYKDSKTTEEYVRFAKNLAFYDYIIVVDNCSPDDSYERLLKIQGKMSLFAKPQKTEDMGQGIITV